MTKKPFRKDCLTCRRGFQMIARDCLIGIRRTHRSASRGDPEGIHRMRICLTRLAAARRFFPTMVMDEKWSALKREIRLLDSVIGKARDDDVGIALIAEMSGRPSSGTNRLTLNQKNTSGHARVARALVSTRYKVLLTNLRTWINCGSWTTAADQSKIELRSASLERFASHWLKHLSHHLVRRCKCARGHRQRHRARQALSLHGGSAFWARRATSPKRTSRYRGGPADTARIRRPA